jgi:hypothetical protein
MYSARESSVPEIIAFFRGDTPEVSRKLFVGATLASLGALFVLGGLAGSLADRAGVSESVRVTAAMIGSTLLLLGLGLGFVSVPQALFSEVTLELRQVTLRFEWGRGKAEEIAWEDIREIRADARTLSIATSSATTVIQHRFGGKTHVELAALLQKNMLRARMSLPMMQS